MLSYPSFGDENSMTDREPHYAGVPPTALPLIPRNPVHVVLDNLRSAFNVGSIFRTADAGAAAHIHLCGMSAHPPHIKLQKTALGAFEYVPWTYPERTVDALDQLGREGITLLLVAQGQHAIGESARQARGEITAQRQVARGAARRGEEE